jgi:malate/lactate dehydrogenase
MSGTEQQGHPRKVVIVGAGDVGASFAYALLQNGAAESIVLIDSRQEQAEGQALDLSHGLPFVPTVAVRAGSADDYADASVIVITAGAKQKPGETRLNLLKRNAHIVGQIMGEVTARESRAVVVITSNPVDVLTYLALKHRCHPTERKQRTDRFDLAGGGIRFAGRMPQRALHPFSVWCRKDHRGKAVGG